MSSLLSRLKTSLMGLTSNLLSRMPLRAHSTRYASLISDFIPRAVNLCNRSSNLVHCYLNNSSSCTSYWHCCPPLRRSAQLLIAILAPNTLYTGPRCFVERLWWSKMTSISAWCSTLFRSKGSFTTSFALQIFATLTVCINSWLFSSFSTMF